jgi:phosphoglycolate phosphatase-like HAD superfamily hydrolase
MRLLLFDVDGTLVTARGAGRRALARALEQVFGTAGAIGTYDLRGATDRAIVHDVMTQAGFAADAVYARLDDCFEAYARALAGEIGDGSGVVVLPGVAEVIRRLDGHAGAMLGLVTGNIEEGARIKLEPAGLWPYFRTGAFGSDDADRRRLPSLAARRAHALVGYPFRPDEVVVIGDTPRDVECARAFGAMAVAVASGMCSREELAATGPDVLLDSLADVEEIVRALL